MGSYKHINKFIVAEPGIRAITVFIHTF